MRARLDGDPHRPATGEPTLEPFRGGRDAGLLDDLAASGVEETEMAVAVAEVDASGDVGLVRHGCSSFSAGLCASVARYS
jgi:hypothetical protein